MRKVSIVIRPLLLGLPLAAGCMQAPETEYRGRYYYGHEVDVFEPCNSADSFWVSHGWGSINADVKGFSMRTITKPYQPVYIEFSGHRHHEEAGGFAADYDGIVHISRVTELAAEPPPACR